MIDLKHLAFARETGIYLGPALGPNFPSEDAKHSGYGHCAYHDVFLCEKCAILTNEQYMLTHPGKDD